MSSHPSPFAAGGSRRRLIAAVVAAGMIAASTAAIDPAAATAGPPPTTAPLAAPETHTVTLVTGDVVTVRTLADGKTLTEVDQPDDATGGFSVQQHGDDLYVLPDEAIPLLADDQLDQRLFNVTDLIEMGYDDAGTSQLPLIATYPEASVRTTAAVRGTRIVHDLPAINGHSLTTDKEQARTLWSTLTSGSGSSANRESSGITKLWLDGQVHSTLADSVPQVGAPEAWDAGYDGDGVTVAVLDTGIDPTHPDLADHIQDTVSFVPDEDPTDPRGHGTHVASIIAGTGAASDGDNTGVAPGADLIIGKVLNNNGIGYDSWIIAGMQWAAESGADVVNMSLGNAARTDVLDPMTLAVDALSAQHDTLFVIAAGNNGMTIGTPGNAESALTVGAVDKQDLLAGFSSVGPLAYSGAVKPDLTAPGVAVNAARSQQSTGDGMYVSKTGTSMAAPHVAGAAAILAQQHPEWTNTQLKDALMSSAEDLGDSYTAFQVGTGRLDVAAAVDSTVRAAGSAFIGYFEWPHQPTDAPVTEPVTFTNSGATAVTLDLATTGSNAFTLDTPTVTVPAGGQADVPVTADPNGIAIGSYTGYLVGTDPTTGQTVTRTALGLLKEDERYGLTIKARDHNGEPMRAFVLLRADGEWFPRYIDVDGERTLRLPPGNYTMETKAEVPGERADSLGLALLAAPETVLDKPTEVTLDASQARLLDTTTPQRTQDRQRLLQYTIDHGAGTGPYYYLHSIAPEYDDVYVLPTERSVENPFAMAARWRKGEPVLSLRALGLLPIDAVVQPGSTITTGKQWLRPVYAGTGAPKDYTDLDVDGRVAVVTRSDEVSAPDRAAAAATAGAELLLVVNDSPGILYEHVGESPIPVASIHRDIGELLTTLATHGTPPLKVDQEKYPDTIYDLAQVWREQVPDQPLTYHPSHHDLARIDARYHADQDTEGSGYRTDTAIGVPYANLEPEWHPGTRTEWVTPDIPWVESHRQRDSTVVADPHTYTKGTTTRLDWFAPAIRPAFNQSAWTKNSRYQDRMTLSPHPWSPSGTVLDYRGIMRYPTAQEHLKLYQGDTLLHEDENFSHLIKREVPAGTLPYRLVLDASRPADEWRLSTRTHTEWDFISSTNQAGPSEPLPITLLQLDYELETDLRGDVKAGTRQEISITARPQPGGSGTGIITAVELEVSYDDGTTWQPVTLTQGDNDRHTGTLKLPKDRDGFISVRATAQTDTGFAIRQEIIRAYGLR
ncbi:S8 family peptidase [Salinispora tropica]|nr:S8 family serine peptidase [Salinispora tropica]